MEKNKIKSDRSSCTTKHKLSHIFTSGFTEIGPMLGSTLHGPYSGKALSLWLYLPLKDLNAPKNYKSTLHKILESSYICIEFYGRLLKL
jgi:hypothetical protein